MRIAVFFIYLFFHLLSGGNVVYAASHSDDISRTLQSGVSTKYQPKYVQSIPTTFFITTAEFDLEEDLSNNENFTSASASMSCVKDFLKQFWISHFCSHSLINSYNSQTKFRTPVCVQSYPIYIVQQVLRI